MTCRGDLEGRGRPVALGARHIVDDSDGLFLGGIGFEEDGAVGVEELVGDVGQDGGAAGGDAAFGDERRRRARNLLMSTAESNSESSGRRSAEKSSESFCGAEPRRRSARSGGNRGWCEYPEQQDGTATVGGEMAAAWMIGRAGLADARVIFCSFLGERGAHPPSR